MATQPSGAAPSVAFATQPVVHVRSNGVTDAADNTTVVTVSIVAGTGAAGAALTGTTTATAVAGVATFTNLGINTAGTGYQLRFTATGVTEATSSTFAITAPAREPGDLRHRQHAGRAPDLALHLRHERLGSAGAARESRRCRARAAIA